jgi:hypothetical protein
MQRLFLSFTFAGDHGFEPLLRGTDAKHASQQPYPLCYESLQRKMKRNRDYHPRIFMTPSKATLTNDKATCDDLLDFQPLARTLAEIIVNEPVTQLPMTVGVFGPWGSGKSTFTCLLQAEIETLGSSCI